VLDKREAGAGASGIACGTVRNNYFQPAMRELMAHSVSVWESDPDAFSYHPVGFVQIAPEAMSEDVAQIYSEQQAIGYPSVLIEGKADCQRYLLDMFDDWQAPGSTTVLHEKKGGYANNIRAVRGLAAKAEAEGVQIAGGVRVTGFGISGNAVTSVETDQGAVACDQLVIAAGPWIRDLWAWLDLPETITVAEPGGTGETARPMWTYWALQEGTLAIVPAEFTDNRGAFPPVTHVDSDVPLYDDISGDLITDHDGLADTSCQYQHTSLPSFGCRSPAPPVRPPCSWPASRELLFQIKRFVQRPHGELQIFILYHHRYLDFRR